MPFYTLLYIGLKNASLDPMGSACYTIFSNYYNHTGENFKRLYGAYIGFLKNVPTFVTVKGTDIIKVNLKTTTMSKEDEEERKYYIEDLETGDLFPVTKEQYEARQRMYEAFKPKLAKEYIGKVIMISTPAGFDKDSFKELFMKTRDMPFKTKDIKNGDIHNYPLTYDECHLYTPKADAKFMTKFNALPDDDPMRANPLKFAESLKQYAEENIGIPKDRLDYTPVNNKSDE